MTNEESICHRAFSAMVDDVETLSLVRECRELEERYKSNFTSAILSAKEPEDGLECTKHHQQERPIAVVTEGFQISVRTLDR